MNWDFLNDVDDLAFQLECAADNLVAVHSVMEDEGGANWERRCNAIFSTYLQLCNIQKALSCRVEQAAADERKRKEGRNEDFDCNASR